MRYVSEQSRPKPMLQLEDLEVYRAAREFRRAMYAVARKLPDVEKYSLAGQIRRAAVSLTNNIAEGHGRYHYLDNIRFVLMARGSLMELMDDLNVCADESYLPAGELAELRSLAQRAKQLINGYIRYLREQKTGESLKIQVPIASYNNSEDFPDDA
jgi:four helix bundle protein